MIPHRPLPNCGERGKERMGKWKERREARARDQAIGFLAVTIKVRVSGPRRRRDCSTASPWPKAAAKITDDLDVRLGRFAVPVVKGDEFLGCRGW
jgi:hypothetical protein